MIVVADGVVQFADLGGSAQVSFIGDMDLAAVADITASEVERWARCGPVTVELAECTFLDSSVLGLLVRLQRASTSPVTLAHPTPRIARLLDMVGLTGLFQIQS